LLCHVSGYELALDGDVLRLHHYRGGASWVMGWTGEALTGVGSLRDLHPQLFFWATAALQGRTPVGEGGKGSIPSQSSRGIT
jgi:hypothetical protein